MNPYSEFITVYQLARHRSWPILSIGQVFSSSEVNGILCCNSWFGSSWLVSSTEWCAVLNPWQNGYPYRWNAGPARVSENNLEVSGAFFAMAKELSWDRFYSYFSPVVCSWMGRQRMWCPKTPRQTSPRESSIGLPAAQSITTTTSNGA